MFRDHTFEQLWDTAPVSVNTFDPASVAGLPETARRYLLHALAPGAKLAAAVRLRMHGTIRLGADWLPFEATQVLRWDRGFIWRASVKQHGLPITGSDRWLDGEGSMRWRLLGLVPVMTAKGPDISRSAAGRLQIESTLVPGVLLGDEVAWSEPDGAHAGALVQAHGEESHLELQLDAVGALRSMKMGRWGNPDHEPFRQHDFGGLIEEEGTFDGITIPTKLRIGWYAGTPRFEGEGEFFRATLDEVIFR